MLAPDARDRLTTVLERARERGFLGPGPVESHLEHAEALAATVGGRFSGRFLDLGSGAGVPGLALLHAWPGATGTLLDSHRRRCAFVEQVLRELGLTGRATAACGRAEELARQPEFRGAYDLVVARAFGPAATTAECAVGFLRTSGRLVVSEPPGETNPDRWPADGLAELGLRAVEFRSEQGRRFVFFTQAEAPSDRWPRRVGVPAKRPLWAG